MTNATIRESQQVRFEEATPTHEIVAYFDTQLPVLVGGTGLPIFPGYDDLDDIQFAYITLPSGNTVVLGQYENAPQIGVDLYVDLNPKNNPTTIAANIPPVVVETLRYLGIPRETAIWFHEDYEAEIKRLYAENVEFEPIVRNETGSLLGDKKLEPIDCFYYALEIYTRDKLPEYWAQLQHNLGLAYYHRTQGERWRNLQQSLECFHRSLEIFEEHKYPQKWQINKEDLQQSQESWEIEKPSLIRGILDRGGVGHNMNNINLSSANLSKANLSNANLSKANLRGTDLSVTRLFGTNLSNANLSNALLKGADLRGSGMSDAFLNNADLRGADLSNADLRGADLSSADLRGADLKGADFRDTNLSNANLIGANLNIAELSGANVDNAQFGYNEGISDLRRRDLILRGAIFSDNLGDPINYDAPVHR